METDTNSLEGFCHEATIAQIDSGSFPQLHTFFVSDQAARNLLIKSRFQLCNLYPQVYFHFDSPQKEWEKLAEARQELKARREKGEKGLTIQGLMVVQIQRPYLWRDPFIIILTERFHYLITYNVNY